jgi:hypothetical protein
MYTCNVSITNYLSDFCFLSIMAHSSTASSSVSRGHVRAGMSSSSSRFTQGGRTAVEMDEDDGDEGGDSLTSQDVQVHRGVAHDSSSVHRDVCWLCVHLPVCPSVHFSIRQSTCQSLSIFVSFSVRLLVPQSACQSLSPLVSHSVCLSVPQFTCQSLSPLVSHSVRLSVTQSACQSLSPLVSPSVHLSVPQSTSVSVPQSTCQSLSPLVSPSVCLSVWSEFTNSNDAQFEICLATPPT